VNLRSRAGRDAPVWIVGLCVSVVVAGGIDLIRVTLKR